MFCSVIFLREKLKSRLICFFSHPPRCTLHHSLSKNLETYNVKHVQSWKKYTYMWRMLGIFIVNTLACCDQRAKEKENTLYCRESNYTQVQVHCVYGIQCYFSDNHEQTAWVLDFSPRVSILPCVLVVAWRMDCSNYIYASFAVPSIFLCFFLSLPS